MSWIGWAKLRDQRLGNIPYDGGGLIPRRIDLRNTGYLDRLRLVVNTAGAYTVAGPTGLDAFGQYAGPVDRLTVRANSVGVLFDCSGYMTAMISGLDNQYNYGGGAMTPGGAVATATAGAPYQLTAAPALAAFNNQWVYDIPIAFQMANRESPIGLFQTALNSQQVQLEATYRPVSGSAGAPGSCVYTGNPANLNNAAVTGGIDINQVYFEPIPDPKSQPALGFIHQWREFQFPITADGDTEIVLPPSNLYMRVLMQYVEGGAGALAPAGYTTPAALGAIRRIRLTYGANITPYDETIQQVVNRQWRMYNFAVPTGFYVYDLIENARTERDFINSAATTNLRVILTTTGGTYAGGAYVKMAVEQLIPLTPGSVASAGVQGVAV